MSDHLQPLPTVREIQQSAQSHDYTHPLSSVEKTEWYFIFDTLDPFAAPRSDLEKLSQTSPNLRARDWLRGVIDVREMIAAVTGAPF